MIGFVIKRCKKALRGHRNESPQRELCKYQQITQKRPAFLQVAVELMTGFEPVTSSLPSVLEGGLTPAFPTTNINSNQAE